MKPRIDNSGEVISLVTRAGTVLHASLSAVSVLGYRPEEIVGRNAFDLIHPDDRNHLRRAGGAVLSRPCSRQLKIRARRKDGRWCWVESTIYKLPDEFRRGTILANCREIGADREAAGSGEGETNEPLSSNARLEHFAYAIAHDLREPLRTISIFAELLVKDANLDEHAKVLAQFIANGVARMSVLFAGLHSFAVDKLDRSSEPVDLAILVAGVLQDLQHAISTSGAAVTVDPLPLVQGNKVHLARIFQNLIVNAIKYRSEAPVRIHVAAERLGSKWIVRIKDNGVGIPPENHEQVFDLFKRLHGSEIPGAGLGLAICRKMVEAMGDAIWVESAPGSGSTFCFTTGAISRHAEPGSRSDPRPIIAAAEARGRAQHKQSA